MVHPELSIQQVTTPLSHTQATGVRLVQLIVA